MNPMTEKEPLKDGLVEEFHDNGQLKGRGNYKNGKLDGLKETFYSKSDNNPFVLHGPINTRKNYKIGKQDGLHESFHTNGKLQEKGNYNNGKEHGLWEFFHENGQLKTREKYKNGKLGLVENFYKNGQLRNRKNYKIETFKDVFFIFFKIGVIIALLWLLGTLSQIKPTKMENKFTNHPPPPTQTPTPLSLNKEPFD